ncbi:3'-5' exonuclease [Kitasatospora sp. NPDC093806]|uniref:3'-5' exonuclease n=1 Tax=Kitasatospora sp. NPDC093806 TaxID=3155075 RepID=UPI00343D75D9
MLPGPPPGTPADPSAGRGGFAVVDVEATGRSPWRHRVVEVAVVLLDERLRPEGEFCTLLDPLGPVGPTHVHRIAQEDVEGAPRFREIAPRLLELLAGRVLVGHHVTCDRAFLDREFARIGVALPPVPLLCTMRLARDRLPEAGGFGLAACVEAAGLGSFAAHTALGDALATARLLRHCLSAPSDGPDTPGAPGATGPSGEWAEPLREAARLPWPRLGRARSRPSGEPVPLVPRGAPNRLLYGPRTPPAPPPAPVRKASGAMGSSA